MSTNESSKAIVFRSKDGQLLWNTQGFGKDHERMIKDIETAGGTIINFTSVEDAKLAMAPPQDECELFRR
ncbi:MAG TPA: hypothetical protein PK639_04185 [Candidatus Woesebacteria bacterium]|nr:hypothetical protein [Candidatus Woesebacteria bacterium]